jgi:integrase
MARVATKLVPTADGGWMARKRIPEDVQGAYEKLYRVRWEARFRCGPMSIGAVRAQHREWMTEVEARIENIRAERKGEGLTLTDKQARALSGEWYLWFAFNHLEEPSPVAHWELFQERLTEQVFDGARRFGDEDDPHFDVERVWEGHYEAREPARAMAADWAETSQFLHAKRLTLNAASRDLFLDHVCRDLLAALRLLIRRGNRDWSDDTHPREFPPYEPQGDIRLTPEALFTRWVAEAKPARGTIDRWRGVFLKLQEDFPNTSAAALTQEDVQAWCHGLKGPKRSAGTVNLVWKNAGHTIFSWAVGQKLIPRNPFDGIRITVPRKIKTREGKAFNPEEIKIILKAASAISNPQNKTHATRRWVPWLLAYTGARSSEITQLRGVDVVHQDDIPAIRITPEAGTVKTRQPLTVPLHEHLIEQGFLDFVTASGKGPLFYNQRKGSPEPSETRPGTNPPRPHYVRVREELARWIRSLGIVHPEVQPLHAFRHTFKQDGHRNGISERILDAITGHAPTHQGRGYGIPTLIDKATELKKFPRYEI